MVSKTRLGTPMMYPISVLISRNRNQRPARNEKREKWRKSGIAAMMRLIFQRLIASSLYCFFSAISSWSSALVTFERKAHHSRQMMAQVVAAKLDMMLRNQRLLIVRMDDGLLEADKFLRSCIASRMNAVTIAVNKADYKDVRIRNAARW